MLRFVFGAITTFGVVAGEDACDLKNDEQVAMLQTKDRVSLGAGNSAVAQLIERAARDLKTTTSDDMLHLVDAFTKRLRSTAEAIPENEAEALLQRASQGKEMRLLAQSWRDLPDEMKGNFIEAVGESAEVAEALSSLPDPHKLAFLQQLHTTDKTVSGKPQTTTQKTANGKTTRTYDPSTGYEYVYRWTPTSTQTSTRGKDGTGYRHSHSYNYNPNTGGSATVTSSSGGGHSHAHTHTYNGKGSTATNTVSQGGGHSHAHSHTDTPAGSSTVTASVGGGNSHSHTHTHNKNTGHSVSRTVSNGAVTQVGR